MTMAGGYPTHFMLITQYANIASDDPKNTFKKFASNGNYMQKVPSPFLSWNINKTSGDTWITSGGLIALQKLPSYGDQVHTKVYINMTTDDPGNTFKSKIAPKWGLYPRSSLDDIRWPWKYLLQNGDYTHQVSWTNDS